MVTELGAKGGASDLERLTSFMRRHDDLTVAKFIDKMEKALEDGSHGAARASQVTVSSGSLCGNLEHAWCKTAR